MTPDSLDTVVKTATSDIGDCRYGSHDWHPSYLDPYESDDFYRLVRPFKNVLLGGARPVPGEYRCLRCYAVGRYQELPQSVSYEPVIVRVR
jgi:hypothetical protein